ncbi:MAG TPA: NAD-dependent epimerase/dehydratase family protein [Solirubrobacterales bacterium]
MAPKEFEREGKSDPTTLVIGCGFIGSNVVEALLQRGEIPLVFSRSRPAEKVVALLGEENLRLGDASNKEAVEQALEGISRVIFCAGGLLPAASERDPGRDRELTLGPVSATLAALARHPGVRLTYLSSGGTIYGEPARMPVDEDDPTEPISAYGRLHLECEHLIARAMRETGLGARVLRCSTVYGEHQRPDRGQGAVVTFLHRIESEQPIDLYGGGSTIRDYIYVGDVARAVVDTAAIAGGPSVLNVGSGQGTSLLELLRLAEAEVGHRARVVEHPKRNFEIHQIVLDTTRLRELIKFEPTPIEAGIARTLRWLESTSAGTA